MKLAIHLRKWKSRFDFLIQLWNLPPDKQHHGKSI